MVITLGALIIWLIIAALVGFVGELLARRRTRFGIVGAIIIGFIAIFLVVGVLHWHMIALPEWCASHHCYPGCGGLSASMERFRVSSRVWVLCSLLPAWRLRRSASPPLPLVLSAPDHPIICETCSTGRMQKEHEPHEWKEGRLLRVWELSQQGWKQKERAAVLGAGTSAVSQWLSGA
jgi:phosphotransferase system  glucose/maltose/N-acetylglucosamine-specific IIC component